MRKTNPLVIRVGRYAPWPINIKKINYRRNLWNLHFWRINFEKTWLQLIRIKTWSKFSKNIRLNKYLKISCLVDILESERMLKRQKYKIYRKYETPFSRWFKPVHPLFNIWLEERRSVVYLSFNGWFLYGKYLYQKYLNKRKLYKAYFDTYLFTKVLLSRYFFILYKAYLYQYTGLPLRLYFEDLSYTKKVSSLGLSSLYLLATFNKFLFRSKYATRFLFLLYAGIHARSLYLIAYSLCFEISKTRYYLRCLYTARNFLRLSMAMELRSVPGLVLRTCGRFNKVDRSRIIYINIGFLDIYNGITILPRPLDYISVFSVGRYGTIALRLWLFSEIRSRLLEEQINEVSYQKRQNLN